MKHAVVGMIAALVAATPTSAALAAEKAARLKATPVETTSSRAAMLSMPAYVADLSP
ncbi:hypothetical protein [Caulobacter segnis]|uniref:Uncharacterized protein n=1 Tax=Caulobacter segnis (strain ATCC 21756 / DSM 7131 / JCM 7823 / NBRC 15250 / LMG 17158 / TK0059) TaxID=509190 RepID=D5VEF1_CAUST|nr:hypothetical protein [Caulobacter segnis]ADG08974.1 hypothetical protein Cseg_0458 [Caulobacter segnis ATCC 21756]